MSDSAEGKPNGGGSSSGTSEKEVDPTPSSPPPSQQASNSSTPVHTSSAPVQTSSATTNGDMTQNGHLSPGETTISNGVTHEQITVTSNLSYVPPTSAQNHQRVHSPSNLNQPSPNHRGHSPNRFSPNTHSSRGNSPQHPSTTTTTNQQHVVHVHVDPGETFSVRVGDQIQHIQGKYYHGYCLSISVVGVTTSSFHCLKCPKTPRCGRFCLLNCVNYINISPCLSKS